MTRDGLVESNTWLDVCKDERYGWSRPTGRSAESYRAICRGWRADSAENGSEVCTVVIMSPVDCCCAMMRLHKMTHLAWPLVTFLIPVFQRNLLPHINYVFEMYTPVLWLMMPCNQMGANVSKVRTASIFRLKWTKVVKCLVIWNLRLSLH